MTGITSIISILLGPGILNLNKIIISECGLFNSFLS